MGMASWPFALPSPYEAAVKKKVQQPRLGNRIPVAGRAWNNLPYANYPHWTESVFRPVRVGYTGRNRPSVTEAAKIPRLHRVPILNYTDAPEEKQAFSC